MEEYSIVFGSINQDIETIARLNAEIFSDWGRKPYSAADILERIEGKQVLVLLVVQGEEKVGYCISYIKQKELYLWTCGILPDARRNGLMKRMIEMSEQKAKHDGLEMVTAKCYNRSKNMVRLLLGRGYDITGVDRNQDNASDNSIHLALRL